MKYIIPNPKLEDSTYQVTIPVHPPRSSSVWVEGSRDYRRFDAYLVPTDEAQRVLGDSALETDAAAWLEGRRERLHDRLREVRAKLAAGRLEGVRLWRSVKYEDVYLRAYETPTELRAGLARYFGFYNTRRRHSALDRRTPDAVYFDQAHRDLAA